MPVALIALTIRGHAKPNEPPPAAVFAFLSIKEAGKAVTRDVDRKRLEPLLNELRALRGDESKETQREENNGVNGHQKT